MSEVVDPAVTPGEAFLLVVLFDLQQADVSRFEEYEDLVLPILAEHGANMRIRARATDGRLELHLIEFPSRVVLEAYRSDERRLAHASLFARSGARSEVHELKAGNWPLRAELLEPSGARGL